MMFRAEYLFKFRVTWPDAPFHALPQIPQSYFMITRAKIFGNPSRYDSHRTNSELWPRSRFKNNYSLHNLIPRATNWTLDLYVFRGIILYKSLRFTYEPFSVLLHPFHTAPGSGCHSSHRSRFLSPKKPAIHWTSTTNMFAIGAKHLNLWKCLSLLCVICSSSAGSNIPFPYLYH